MNLRDLILGQNDLPTEAITIPEWKDNEGKPITLTIRTLTATEKETLERSLQDFVKAGDRKTNIRAKIAVLCVVDDQGNPVFSDKDIEVLGKKSAHALTRIFDVVIKINKNVIEDIEKNS